MIHAEGLPNVLARHRRLSGRCGPAPPRSGSRRFGGDAHRSSTVVVLVVPEALDGGAIVRALYERHRTVIAGARNRLSGRVIRIGTMGSFDAGTILTDLACLEDVLPRLGLPVAPGAALAAASAHLRSSP